MLSKLAKLMLTGTSLAPVALVYAWVVYTDGKSLVALALVALAIVLIVIMVSLLRYCRKHLERSKFKVTSIEAADREYITFILLYLSPLFTAQFGDLNWHILIPTMIIFILVISTGYGYHFNPLLGLLGWHFYKVNTDEGVAYVLITKMELRSARQCLTVGQLTEYIVIDLSDNGRSA
ncbi:hypothetical protein [Asticcacaulis sp. YBE204]|uniref:hypothetical protein n=1 Tax=Asticcacaulis sp. YBE204 TaxID=1282363 RepID=UPI0003C405A1|nr:hypothetical protein [Asticcacaulis sp. YBE204]ESQ79292.1 hypothetical protein AEYBE204_09795 [Asticcacaulis sp. YBE204]